MPSLRVRYYWSYVIAKDKFTTKFSIKDKVELMFFLLLCDPAQGFVGKPSDPFQFIS